MSAVGEVYVLPKSALVELIHRVWHASVPIINSKHRVLELTYADCLEFIEMQKGDPGFTLLKDKNLNLYIQIVPRWPLRSKIQVTIQPRSIASLAPHELAEILNDIERTRRPG